MNKPGSLFTAEIKSETKSETKDYGFSQQEVLSEDDGTEETESEWEKERKVQRNYLKDFRGVI